LNRESWLTELAKRVHPLYKGFAMAPYRLTCGWPCRMALGRRRRAIGECHALESSRVFPLSMGLKWLTSVGPTTCACGAEMAPDLVGE
jgi:hypothetical protein